MKKSKHNSVPLPYNNPETGKKREVEAMFDNIAHRYDLLNHLFSLNIDSIWRRRAVKMLQNENPKTILDVATGTGDFAVAASKLSPVRIVGLDLSEKMLQRGREKVKRKNLDHIIELQKGDSEEMSFENSSFDAVLVGFGVRNFENLERGLMEIHRVLKPGGDVVILEFSKPDNSIFRAVYLLYFTRILPFIGRVISKDMRAYSYLPESVNAFPGLEEFSGIMQKCGFEKVKISSQTMGIATIYKFKKVEHSNS